MRNLKRALSLGLTAAMISGLMVMGAGAVSYPDSDQIQNQTAVEILGEIGVMVGDDNGNFNPTQDVTRAEMAVIITRILYGNDLNVDQFKGMNLFTDVPAWAEGFVNLCASLDIVAGVGDGKFAPNETVTAAQAALMLSRALGYFQNNAEFGNDWALAAIRRATSAGIIGDDMVLAANEGLSRDNVAQMTFNTLTKAVPVQYNELLNVYYNENQGITYALTFNYLQTLGYTNFDLVYDNGDTTIYGRPATTWGIGTYRTTTSDNNSGTRYDEVLDADGGLMSSKVQILSRDEIITIENEPTYVYTDATDEEDIYDDLGATICDEDEYDWTVYVNGEEVASADVVVPGRNVSADYAYTGKGAQTEIYVDDADKTVTVVEINYYMGRVASVNEDDGTVTIRTISDAELDDRDFATTEFAKDDYVVYTIDQNADDDFYICEMMEPETVTGTVTKVQNNASADNACLFLDDEKQSYSTHMVYDLNDEGNARHPSTNKEYTLYLDPNGYVLAYSGDTTKSFLYVEDSDEERNHWDTDVVLADGTATTVQVEDEMKKWDDSALYDFLYNGAGNALTSNQNTANEDDIDWLDINNPAELNVYVQMFNDIGANIDADELDEFSRLNTDVSEIDYQIWEYTTNDNDEYTLSGRLTRYAEDVEIVNGRSWMLDVDNTNEGIFSGDISVDNSTVFVDVESGTAYVGRDNVPDVSNARIAYLLENDDYARDVAEIVYILDGDIYDADRIFFVITDADRYTVEYDDELYFQFDNLYVDGRNYDDLYVAYDALIDDAGIQSLANYDNDEDDNDAVTAEIENELAGQVIEVKKSIDGAYATEIEVHPFWDAPITVSETMLDLADNWFEADLDNWHLQKWNTDADTLFVMVTEEYNRSLTEIDGYEVTVEDDDDIVAWENENRFVGTDEDGYATLVQVVKGEDQNADLVYIYKFLPEYHFRDVTVNVNGVEYYSTDREVFEIGELICWMNAYHVDAIINEFEQDMVDAGFVSADKNEYAYSIAGYADYTDVPFDGSEDEWVAVPTGHDDLVINITATNEDIDYDAESGLFLDVTAIDDASPADYIDLGLDGTIRYGFLVSVPAGMTAEEIESVTWLETAVGKDGKTYNSEWKTAYAGDGDFVYNANDTILVQESAAGNFSVSAINIVRVTNAKVNGAPEAPVTYTLTTDAGDTVYVGGTKVDADRETPAGNEYDIEAGKDVVVAMNGLQAGQKYYVESLNNVLTANERGQLEFTMNKDVDLSTAPVFVFGIHYAEGMKVADSTAIVWHDEGNNVVYLSDNSDLTFTTADSSDYGTFNEADGMLPNWGSRASGVKANFGGEGWVKPVANVVLPNDVIATLPDGTKITNGTYAVAMNTVLDLECTDNRWLPYEGAISSYGVAIEGPYVVDGNASLYAGWVVTLDKGVTAKVNGVPYGEGTKLAVYGSAKIDSLKSEGTTIIEAPANNNVLVKGGTTVTSSTSINGTMTLIAASKVTAGDANVTIKFLGSGTAEQTIISTDSNVYVVVGTELSATTSNNKEIVVSGATKVPGVGSVSFVVGNSDIIVTAP